jgi:hypothetical protein
MIYKFSNPRPRYQCDHLGTISCMTAGKIMDRNVLCVICAEGECHLFDLDHHGTHQHHHQAQQQQQTDDGFDDDQISTDNSLDDDEEDQIDENHSHSHHNLTLPLHNSQRHHAITTTIHPFMTQRIPCNVTCVALADIDGNNNVLAFGGIDRHVYLYKYEQQSSGEWKMVRNRKIYMEDNQINSLGRHVDVNGKEGILIGFVTGGYAYLSRGETEDIQLRIFAAEKRRRRFDEEEDEDSQSSTKPVTVLGNAFGTPDTSAFAELGGRLSIHDPLSQNAPWTVDLRQEVMGLYQAEMIKNTDAKQLVLATWDGVTYIIDRERNAVCFNFKERICGFTCGLYSPSPHRPAVSCLIYVPFSDHRIVVYHDVMMNSVASKSLVEQIAFSSCVKDLKRLYNNNDSTMSDEEMRRHLPELTHLFYSCLYSFSEKDAEQLREFLNSSK